MTDEVYRADPSLKGKLRRRLVRLYRRNVAAGALERPMVSFCFDDTPASAVRVGAPMLAERGMRGTYFFCAGLAGTSAHMGEYATRADMLSVATAGHEIGCHTYSHLDCGKADGPAVEAELERNAATFRDWGLAQAMRTFAYPFGDVGFPAKAAAAKRFSLSRALHHGLIEPGVDLNQAPAIGIEGLNGEKRAHDWITRAKGRRAWLILFTHGIEAEPTPFGASAGAFAGVLDRTIAEGFEVVTVADGLHRMEKAA